MWRLKGGGRFVVSPAGWAAARTHPGVMAELNKQAEAIAERAGEGFEATPAEATGGRVRGRAAVITATPRAMVVEARDHVLESLMGGGQGAGKPLTYTTKAGKTRTASQAQIDNWTRGRRK